MKFLKAISNWFKKPIKYNTSGSSKKGKSSKTSNNSKSFKSSGGNTSAAYEMALARRKYEEEKRRKAQAEKEERERRKKIEAAFSAKTQNLKAKDVSPIKMGEINRKISSEKSKKNDKPKPTKKDNNNGLSYKLEGRDGKITTAKNVDDLKYSNLLPKKYDERKTAAAATVGFVEGMSLGALSKAEKKFGENTIEKKRKTYTKSQQRAEGIGEVAGNMATYAMAMPVGEGVGKMLTNTKTGTKIAKKTTQKLANKRAIKWAAKKAGKPATEVAEKVTKGIATDLGLNLTAGNVEAVINASDKKGLKNKAKSYAGSQAANMVIGGATEVLAPTVKTVAKVGGKKLKNVGKAYSKAGYQPLRTVSKETMEAISKDANYAVKKYRKTLLKMEKELDKLKSSAHPNSEHIANLEDNISMVKRKLENARREAGHKAEFSMDEISGANKVEAPTKKTVKGKPPKAKIKREVEAPMPKAEPEMPTAKAEAPSPKEREKKIKKLESEKSEKYLELDEAEKFGTGNADEIHKEIDVIDEKIKTEKNGLKNSKSKPPMSEEQKYAIHSKLDKLENDKVARQRLVEEALKSGGDPSEYLKEIADIDKSINSTKKMLKADRKRFETFKKEAMGVRAEEPHFATEEPNIKAEEPKIKAPTEEPRVNVSAEEPKVKTSTEEAPKTEFKTVEKDAKAIEEHERNIAELDRQKKELEAQSVKSEGAEKEAINQQIDEINQKIESEREGIKDTGFDGKDAGKFDTENREYTVDEDAYREFSERIDDYNAHVEAGEPKISTSTKTSMWNARSKGEENLIEEMMEAKRFDYRTMNHNMIQTNMTMFVEHPEKFEKLLGTVKDFNNGGYLKIKRGDWKELQYQAHAAFEIVANSISQDKDNKIFQDQAENLLEFIISCASESGTNLELRRYMSLLNPRTRCKHAVNRVVAMLDGDMGARLNGIAQNVHGDSKQRHEILRNAFEQLYADEPAVRKLGGKQYKQVDEWLRNHIENLGEDKIPKQHIQDAIDSVTAAFNALGLDKPTKDQSVALFHARELFHELQNPKLSEELAEEKLAETITYMNRLRPMTVLDYVNEWRYMSMLGNFKTYNRNIVGNFIFGSVFKRISGAIGSPMEKIAVKMIGDEKHFYKQSGINLRAIAESQVYVKPKTEAGKLAKQCADEDIGIILGTTTKTNAEIAAQRSASSTFGKGWDATVGKGSRFVSDKMNKADKPFLEQRYRECFYNLSKKNNLMSLKEGSREYKKVLKQVREQSMQYAKESTFREYNSVANSMNNFMRKARDPNADGFTRALAGIANIKMPFVNTPLNVTKQSINYSPLGLMRGCGDIAISRFSAKKAGKTARGKAIAAGLSEEETKRLVKEAESRAVVDRINKSVEHLANGVTGSGVMLLGYHLAKHTGIVTTYSNPNDDKDKIKKANGMQDYSITFEWLDGEKYSATLDWLTPTASTFFIGAEIAKQVSKSDADGIIERIDRGKVIASRIIEPWITSSMFTGINNTFETIAMASDTEVSPALKMMDSITSDFVSQLVPTIWSQGARSLYKGDLKLSGKNDTEYIVNRLKSKVGAGQSSILTEGMGLAIDTHGNIKNKRSIGKTLNTFFNPANVSKVTIDDNDEESFKVYDKALKDGVERDTAKKALPSLYYKDAMKIGRESTKDKTGKTVGKVDEIELSNKAKQIYNQARNNKYSGVDAMTSALRARAFNYYGKGEISDKKREELIEWSKNKTADEVKTYLIKTKWYKNANAEDKAQVLGNIHNKTQTNGKAQGFAETGERAVMMKQHGYKAVDYDFRNQLNGGQQENYKQYADVISKDEAVEFHKNSLKNYQYASGKFMQRFTKASALEALAKMDISEEKKAALYNTMKPDNYNPYGVGGRGWRRWGRRWHRWGGWGSYVPVTKGVSMSAFKPGGIAKGKRVGGEDGTYDLAKMLKKIDKANSKKTAPPPTNKTAKVDLPNKKKR